MTVHLRGNLGLKSSLLAPTSSKLSTQHLVIDHMINHYTKIDQSKPSVDTRAPKSLSTSQKMRDIRTREEIISRLETHPLMPSHVYAPELTVQHPLQIKPTDIKKKHLYSDLRSSLADNPITRNNAMNRSASQVELYTETYSSRQMAAHFTSQFGTTVLRDTANSYYPQINSFVSVAIPTHDSLKITYSGDVLDRRSHLFTEPDRLFVPRTLINGHESRLRKSKFYNPPRTEHTIQRADSIISHTDGFLPQKEGIVQRTQSVVQHNNGTGKKLDENERLQSSQQNIKHKKHFIKKTTEVFNSIPMNTTLVDNDYNKENWLHGQTKKVHIRACDNKQLRSPTNKANIEHTLSELGQAIKMELMTM
uniref:Uncharacterized protein n=1 Tax=Arion vulgaris TaxID=1028688 RepID=A0A0B7A5H6_9EUPU